MEAANDEILVENKVSLAKRRLLSIGSAMLPPRSWVLGLRTAMEREHSMEMTKAISIHVEEKTSGRCRPSFSISATERPSSATKKTVAAAGGLSADLSIKMAMMGQMEKCEEEVCSKLSETRAKELYRR